MRVTNNLDEPEQPGTPQAPTSPQESRQASTSVLERTEEKRAPGDGDRFAHFVRRDRVSRSLITGQPVIALCGKVWVPMRDPSKFPVCPRCKALRDEMGKHGRNWPYSDGGSDK